MAVFPTLPPKKPNGVVGTLDQLPRLKGQRAKDMEKREEKTVRQDTFKHLQAFNAADTNRPVNLSILKANVLKCVSSKPWFVVKRPDCNGKKNLPQESQKAMNGQL